MHLLDLASAVAVLAASVPPLYFAVRLRGPRTSFRILVVILAASFLVHGAFHALDAFAFPEDAVVGLEAISSALILVFALAYWSLRGGSRP